MRQNQFTLRHLWSEVSSVYYIPGIKATFAKAKWGSVFCAQKGRGPPGGTWGIYRVGAGGRGRGKEGGVEVQDRWR